MRVVFLTHNYPRHPGDVAGGFLHPLAMALRARDVDVRVVAPSDRGSGGRAVLDGVPVHRVRYGSPEVETLGYGGTIMDAVASPAGWFSLAAMFKALRKGARSEFDGVAGGVVHAHWWIPGGLASPPEIPLVLTCHGTDVRLLERNAIARRLSWTPLSRAKVVTTVSKTLAEALRNKGQVSVNAGDVVPMPVTQLPRPVATGGGGALVLGRLSAQKRIHLAIDAYAEMRQGGYDLPLTIAGDGAKRGELEAQAKTLKISEHIRFLGEIAPTSVPEVLTTADICLMPAHDEGLGLAAAEALMQGVPVVACSDGGGLLDIVPATGGGRVTEPAPNAIASAALSLLGDGEARKAALQLGVIWQHRLDPETVAAKCHEWYQRALA